MGIATLCFAQSHDDLNALAKRQSEISGEEIVRLLQASRAAVNHHSFHVVPMPKVGSSDITLDVQMGPAGWPRYLHEADIGGSSFLDFTGKRAKSCAGAILEGEFVVDYITENEVGLNPVDVQTSTPDQSVRGAAGSRVTIQAHVRDSYELLAQVFEMYAGDSTLIDGRRAVVAGHDARALITRHKLRPTEHLPGGLPYPPEIQDWLWIDTDSLFFVQWEVRNAGTPTDYGYVFREDTVLDLRPPKFPDGVTIPTCVK